MRKVIELAERFPTGEPTIQIVGQWGHSRWHLEKTAFAKGAASPAYDYLTAYGPKEGCTIILVNALGAYETYDDNRNGDGFPEHPYRVGQPTKCGHPECNPQGGRLGWISEPETLLHHYTTYEAHGGIYQHHANKDQTKSLGKILKAVWNPRMHRVELILEVQNKKSPELVERINAGEFPAVSMGCHVRWDVCTICGHRAPTRAQYCTHAKFALRGVDKRTGEKIAVLNPSPRFFDISIVYRPADPTGWMLKKVADVSPIRASAELGELLDDLESKQAEVRKLSDIQKSVTGQTLATETPETIAARKLTPMLREVVRQGPEAGPKEVRAMAEYPLPVVLSTLAIKQATLTTGELARVLLAKQGTEISAQALAKLAALQPTLLDIVAAYPKIDEKLGPLVLLDPKLASQKLADELQGWLSQRAFSPGGPLAATPLGAHYQAHEPAKTDILSMTDPNNGQLYNTTRGAAMTANHADHRGTLAGAGLLSALYSLGIHKATKGRLPWQLGMALSLPLGYLSSKKLVQTFNPYRNSHYLTDQGIPVSGATEFVKSSALLVRFVRDHEAAHGETLKVAHLASDCEQPWYEAVETPDVDLDRLLNKIGTLIPG